MHDASAARVVPQIIHFLKIARTGWRQKVEEGKVDDARCSGTISMVNQAGETVASWTFDRCWPTKVSGPQFNSGGNEVGVEELEIVHEGMRRVQA